MNAFEPGKVWLDTDGKPIQAHGGGVLYDQGVYYWFGENKDTPTQHIGRRVRVDVVGVSCYSSEDLYNWKNEGVVLPAVQDDPEHHLHPSQVVERPKVLYNDKTGKYVMWMHLDSPDYKKAMVGVAVADRPTGPYTFIEGFRPCGEESRDMTLYKDDDGKAYAIFGSRWHTIVIFAELTDDFLQCTGRFTEHFPRNVPGLGREAPAIFKHDGRYYFFSSGTTGWQPNPAEYAVAENINGPWKDMGDPCVGEDAETTFHAQSTFVLPVVGKDGAYIFMADRWIRDDLGDSRYVWLPIEIDGETVRLRWRDRWDLSVFG